MAKTNYTKVEEALAEGMRKIEVDRLLTVADENKKPKKPPASPRHSESKIEELRLKRLTSIRKELEILQKLGKDPYTELKIDKQEMEKFLRDSPAMKSEDWEKVKVFKEKIAAYKRRLEGKVEPEETALNEDIVEQQRKKQQTKRFNINDKWIPLR